MGTSTSSKGPGANVPIVPPWVGDPDAPQDGAPDAPPLAPIGRFRPARTSLGKFGGSGDKGHLRRGLGHYSRGGMGGAATATKRMSGSAASAGAIYEALEALANGQPLPAEFGLAPDALDGKSQCEIIDILVDAIRPLDGTQDAEAARDSAARALAEVLADDAEWTDLQPDQIERVVEGFLGNDLALRIELDVGKAVIAKAPNLAEGLDRLEEMKGYVREVVAQRYAARRTLEGKLDRKTVASMCKDAIRDTFDVFESFLS